ncbi:gamma-glutamylcyclotransferase family protein [Pontiella sp.]|uniref:gamma-glutamylcyclotransferase family protein n=1 Tax=Pontiella sp. TaxID=2837462 RepID=UPI003569AC61
MNLFAYGTLMWPEVLQSVAGRRLEGTPAILEGYQRLRVVDQHYPVVVPSSGDAVEGMLYLNLTEREFRFLDAFEGEEYDRIEVGIGCETAFVYVLAEAWRHIAADVPWSPDQLTAEHLSAFCSEYKGWAEMRSRE